MDSSPAERSSARDASPDSGELSTWARYREVPVAAGLLLLFGWLLLTLSDQITGRAVGAYVSAEFWPRALLTVGTALSAVYLVRTVVAGMRAAPATDAAGEAPGQTYPGRLLAAGGLLVAYIVVMQLAGFVPVTLVFSLAFLLLMGVRRWWLLVGIPIALAVFVLAVFTRFLTVPLPRGVGPFLEFSTWLY